MREEGKRLLSKANVVGFGQGYKYVKGNKTNIEATSVFVKEKVPVQSLDPQDVVPQKAFGLPTDVIETGEIVAFSGINTGWVRPLIPGYSIGHYKITAGTLGAIVDRNGEKLILSNNHVLANCNDANVGDSIIQPGSYDGGTEKVAELCDFEEIEIMSASCKIAKVIAHILNTIA